MSSIAIECLESRLLFMVPPEGSYLERLQTHTLTEADLQENGLVDMEWQGQRIYAKANEWIIAFERSDPIQFIGPASPLPEGHEGLISALENTGLGLSFLRYVGSTDAVLIFVPLDVSYPELDGALADLPRYKSVGPNAIGWITSEPIVSEPLVVTGAMTDDVITVRLTPDQAFIEVIINDAEPAQHPRSSVSGISVHGGGGNDIIDCSAVPIGVTLSGGAGNDRLIGGRFADVIRGGDGNDTIHAGDGNDSVYGGLGHDHLGLGAGHDLAFGGDGDDGLLGRRHSDTLYGGDGKDTLLGHTGDDLLYGNSGDDRLVDGEGEDTVRGGLGNDFMRTWDGPEMGRFFGGEGEDSLVFENWSEGLDLLEYSGVEHSVMDWVDS